MAMSMLNAFARSATIIAPAPRCCARNSISNHIERRGKPLALNSVLLQYGMYRPLDCPRLPSLPCADHLHNDAIRIASLNASLSHLRRLRNADLIRSTFTSMRYIQTCWRVSLYTHACTPSLSTAGAATRPVSPVRIVRRFMMVAPAEGTTSEVTKAIR